ncbi:MAG: hypothetical protein HRU15_11225 [Planctomycetes bacterium]|nr:hypothetical protein [Planctomycetota bacterium]
MTYSRTFLHRLCTLCLLTCTISSYQLCLAADPAAPEPPPAHANELGMEVYYTTDAGDDLYKNIDVYLHRKNPAASPTNPHLVNDEPVRDPDPSKSSCPWAIYLPKDKSDLNGAYYPYKFCHGNRYEGWYTYMVYYNDPDHSDGDQSRMIMSNTDPLIYDATQYEYLLTEANYTDKENLSFVVTRMYLIKTGLINQGNNIEPYMVSPAEYDSSQGTSLEECILQDGPDDIVGEQLRDTAGATPPIPRWNQLAKYRIDLQTSPAPIEPLNENLPYDPTWKDDYFKPFGLVGVGHDKIKDFLLLGSPLSERGRRANEKQFKVNLNKIADYDNDGIADAFWIAENECSQNLFTALCDRVGIYNDINGSFTKPQDISQANNPTIIEKMDSSIKILERNDLHYKETTLSDGSPVNNSFADDFIECPVHNKSTDSTAARTACNDYSCHLYLQKYRAMNYISWDDLFAPQDLDTSDGDDTGFFTQLNTAIDDAIFSEAGVAPAIAIDFRVPNEVEWEYVCRMASSTAFNTGHSISSAGEWDTEEDPDDNDDPGVTYDNITFSMTESPDDRVTAVIRGPDNSIIDANAIVRVLVAISASYEASGLAELETEANFNARYNRRYLPAKTFKYDPIKKGYFQHYTNDLSLDILKDPTMLSEYKLDDVNEEVELLEIQEDTERVYFDRNHFLKATNGLFMPIDSRGRFQSSIIEINGTEYTSTSFNVDQQALNADGTLTYTTDPRVRPIEQFMRLNGSSILPPSDSYDNPFLHRAGTIIVGMPYQVLPTNEEEATALVYYREQTYDEDAFILGTTGPAVPDESDFPRDNPIEDMLEEAITDMQWTLWDNWKNNAGHTSWIQPGGGSSRVNGWADNTLKPGLFPYVKPSNQGDSSGPAGAWFKDSTLGFCVSLDGTRSNWDNVYVFAKYTYTGNNTDLRDYHNRDALQLDDSISVEGSSADTDWHIKDMHGNLAELCLPYNYTTHSFNCANLESGDSNPVPIHWNGSDSYDYIDQQKTKAIGDCGDYKSPYIPARGGHFSSSSDDVRSAARIPVASNRRDKGNGFRLLIPATHLKYASAVPDSIEVEDIVP